mmetsp:Transcript_43387/g.104860  ORF Transcript_43387/g.104860 Transcript_43387/m.104860 type:complete len:142 (-) Transcript_43387:1078-1503(-)
MALLSSSMVLSGNASAAILKSQWNTSQDFTLSRKMRLRLLLTVSLKSLLGDDRSWDDQILNNGRKLFFTINAVVSSGARPLFRMARTDCYRIEPPISICAVFSFLDDELPLSRERKLQQLLIWKVILWVWSIFWVYKKGFP